MSRPRLAMAAAGAVAALALSAAPAGAAVLTLGLAPDKMKPGCPAKATCRVVTRTTAYQVRNNAKTTPVQAKKNGWLVALSLRLGAPNKKQIHFFNTTYGGTPRASLAVLRPVKGKPLTRTLVSQSGFVHLQPYFGGVSDFPLHKPLHVKAGDFVGLNVPTWAPILAVGQATSYSWRASRPADQCGDEFLATPLFIDAPGDDALFACKYATARLTYTVTEVTSPTPRYDKDQNPIKKKK